MPFLAAAVVLLSASSAHAAASDPVLDQVRAELLDPSYRHAIADVARQLDACESPDPDEHARLDAQTTDMFLRAASVADRSSGSLRQSALIAERQVEYMFSLLVPREHCYWQP